MIEELFLKGIGGVQEAHLLFNSDFCVITGESGSGKSSIVRALELCSGRRAQSTLLHGNVDEGEVFAAFSRDRSQDVSPAGGEDDVEEALIVRRTLSKTGRSRFYLQDRPVSLNVASEKMGILLRIQSQFAQMELMDSRHQLELLDYFGGARILRLRDELERLVLKGVEEEKSARGIRKRREEMEERLVHAQKVLDLGRGLDLSSDVENRLAGELRDLDLRVEKQKAMEKSLWMLQGGPGSEGISEILESALSGPARFLSEGRDSQWDKDCETLLEATENIIARLKNWVHEESLEELDEARENVQKKCGRIQKMRRLAGVQGVEELHRFCRESQKDIQWMVESVATMEELAEKARASRREASQLAMELRRVRQEVAVELEEKINSYLRELLMDSNVFQVKLYPQDKLRIWGADEVIFELKGTGDFSGPVSSVASGGELSRIQLALQLCLPPERLPASLVFDEVEAGLGGRAALQAGHKLRDLSRRCQVILVTHEAAIAALAQQHFVVEREGNMSRVTEVAGERRVQEIARMLAGRGNSPEAMNHARVLLQEPQVSQ